VDHEEKVPAASIAEVERFWADGHDASQSSTGAKPETIADLSCIRCGERGGQWFRNCRVALGDEIQLERNQRVSVSLSDLSGALYIFTHQCSTKIDFPGVGAVPLDQASPGVAPRRESAGDGVEVVRPPDPVAGVEYRAIARELLGALFTMIAINGMPTKSAEAASEIAVALHHAFLAKVDEVVL
jgi:hypothetical protein